MKHYRTCASCGFVYNVSRFKDNTKVYVCADCTNRDKAKMMGWKYYPIYNAGGFATVKGVNAR